MSKRIGLAQWTSSSKLCFPKAYILTQIFHLCIDSTGFLNLLSQGKPAGLLLMNILGCGYFARMESGIQDSMQMEFPYSIPQTPPLH